MNLYDSAEKLTFKQIVVVSLLIAIAGLTFGFLSGQFFQGSTPAKTPAKPATLNNAVPTYSGRLLPASELGKTFTHSLTDASGNIVAYLQADDDKLKVILPTTEVVAIGDVIGKEGEVPIVRVRTIKF